MKQIDQKRTLSGVRKYNYRHWRKNKEVRKRFFDRLIAKLESDNWVGIWRAIWLSKFVDELLSFEQGKYFERLFADILADEDDTIISIVLDVDQKSSDLNEYGKADILYAANDMVMPYNLKTSIGKDSVPSRRIKIFDISFNTSDDWKGHIRDFVNTVGDDNLLAMFCDIRDGSTCIAITSLREIQDTLGMSLEDITYCKSNSHVVITARDILEPAKENGCYIDLPKWNESEREKWVEQKINSRLGENKYRELLDGL